MFVFGYCHITSLLWKNLQYINVENYYNYPNGSKLQYLYKFRRQLIFRSWNFVNMKDKPE